MKAKIIIQSKFTNFDFKIKSAFSILAVSRVAEPDVVDPEPGVVDPEPGVVDPEPTLEEKPDPTDMENRT